MTVQSDMTDIAPEPMDISDKIQDNEDDPLHVFHRIIDETITKDKLISTDYQSLAEIAQNNPLAIEDRLTKIFRKILLEEKVSDDDRELYDKLMNDIFDACVRLRREHKIVSWILMALHDTLGDSNIVDKIDHTNIHILSPKFIDDFSSSIRNLTTSHVMSMLTSFIHHLQTCLTSPDDSKNRESFSMNSKSLVIYSDVIKQLGVGFLEGVDVFNVTWPLLRQQKFVSTLVSLGQSLLKFMKALKRKFEGKDYQIVLINVWKIVETWQTLVHFIKHYAENAVSESHWNEILSCAKNIEEILRKMEHTEETRESLVFLKLREHKINCIGNLFEPAEVDESSPPDINDLDPYWTFLMDRYPQTIKNLDNLYISKLSQILVENLNIADEKIKQYPIQDNRNLVTALVFEIFRKINGILGESTCLTKKLTDRINNISWSESGKYSKLLKSFKKILADPHVVNVDLNSVSNISEYLNVLLNLPIMYLGMDLKTIIILIILTIKKEKSSDPKFDTLCIEILSDLSESYTEDLMQYISPNFFISELSKSPEILSRIIEVSLKNTSNYEQLRECIKSHLDDKNTSMIVKCVDKARTKMKSTEDKQQLIKFEKQLVKKILSHLNDSPVDCDHLKSLTMVLRARVALQKVDDSLVEKIHSTLETLLGKGNEKNDLKYTKESYEFIRTILQYRGSGISIEGSTIRNIWSLMLKKSCPAIVLLLIEAFDLKFLNYSLNTLRKETMESIEKNDGVSFENCLIIWDSAAKLDMGMNREKIRQASFQGLMQSLKSTEALLTDDMKIQVLKFFTNTLSSRRMIIPDKTIDLVLSIVNSFMNDSTVTLSTCQQTLNLCSGFLKFRSGVTIDNLPIITKLYLKCVRITVEDARKGSDQKELHSLLTLEIQKLATAFVKLKRDISKISPYIIADLIGIYYGGGVIPNYVKEPLDDSVSQFLSSCDQHAISLLFRVLPPSMQEIFKTLYDTYIKFHKFTGKI